MHEYSKAEIDDAYANYKELARQSYETGDWTIFPRVYKLDSDRIRRERPVALPGGHLQPPRHAQDLRRVGRSGWQASDFARGHEARRAVVGR